MNGIPEKWDWDPGLRTWDPYMGPGTQDPPPGTIHLGPGIHTSDLRLGTLKWDPGPKTFTWDPVLCSDWF